MKSLVPGDRVMLLDVKKRRYLVTLAEAGEFHTHAGFVPHDEIIGQPEGAVVRSTKGAEYTVLRPTLEDYVLEMPRGAQVIYPKDLAPMCMLADIGPGMRVFETGIGSGALSTTMLRWGADIVGYEIREDFANRAKANVRDFLGSAVLDRYDVHIADSYEGIDPAHGPFDRVVLDLPEPWNVIPHVEPVLLAGGVLVAYTPSIVQATQVRDQLKGRWIDARTIEVLHRGWHIDGQSVRPDHRMVAHTAFLTVARFLGQGNRGMRFDESAERFGGNAPNARHPDGMTRRNAIWLAAILVVATVTGYFGGWLVGLIAAAIVLVAHEVVERRQRRQRRAARSRGV